MPSSSTPPPPTGAHPWTPLTLRGGVRTNAEGLIDTRDGGLIIPARTTVPTDADLHGGSPPVGRLDLKSDDRRLWARVGGGDGGTYAYAQLDTQGPISTRVARLAADATRTSTTTITEETGLTLTEIRANSTWLLDGLLIVSGTVGLDVALDVPGGDPASDITWGDDLTSTLTVQATNTPVERAIAVSGTPTFVRLHGTFTFGQFLASLTFLWAQTTSDAAPTTIHRGSWMRAQRVT